MGHYFMKLINHDKARLVYERALHFDSQCALFTIIE